MVSHVCVCARTHTHTHTHTHTLQVIWKGWSKEEISAESGRQARRPSRNPYVEGDRTRIVEEEMESKKGP